MRTLPGNTHLAYTVMHEAHWAPISWTGIGEPDTIMVAASSAGGGSARWEFAIAASKQGLCLRIYAEAWPAFHEIADFFTALPGMRTLNEVRSLLDLLGAVDQTEREPAAR